MHQVQTGDVNPGSDSRGPDTSHPDIQVSAHALIRVFPQIDRITTTHGSKDPLHRVWAGQGAASQTTMPGQMPRVH